MLEVDESLIFFKYETAKNPYLPKFFNPRIRFGMKLLIF